MKPKSLIVLRTHFLDAGLRSTFDALSTLGVCDVCIVLDDTGAPQSKVEPGLIALNIGRLAQIGLPIPDHVGWVCGDYALFAAMQILDDYEFYWLIEYDVHFNLADIGNFFRSFDAGVTSDFIAMRFGPAGMDWVWSKTMEAFDGPIHGCLFGVVRLSQRAIVQVLEARRELAHANLSPALFEFPNDEVFCATVLAGSGLECRDLNAFGRVFYTLETVGLSRVFPLHDLIHKSNDGYIYHPVLTGERLLSKYTDVAEQGDDDLFDFVREMSDHVAFDLDPRQRRSLKRAIARQQARDSKTAAPGLRALWRFSQGIGRGKPS